MPPIAIRGATLESQVVVTAGGNAGLPTPINPGELNVVAFVFLFFVVLTLGRTDTRPVTAAEAATSLLICAASVYLLVLVHEVGHIFAGL